MKIIGDNL